MSVGTVAAMKVASTSEEAAKSSSNKGSNRSSMAAATRETIAAANIGRQLHDCSIELAVLAVAVVAKGVPFRVCHRTIAEFGTSLAVFLRFAIGRAQSRTKLRTEQNF